MNFQVRIVRVWVGSLQLPYAISFNHPSINRSFHASTSILRIRILTSFRLPTPTISRIDGEVSLDNDEFMQCAGWITRTYCIVHTVQADVEALQVRTRRCRHFAVWRFATRASSVTISSLSPIRSSLRSEQGETWEWRRKGNRSVLMRVQLAAWDRDWEWIPGDRRSCPRIKLDICGGVPRSSLVGKNPELDH